MAKLAKKRAKASSAMKSSNVPKTSKGDKQTKPRSGTKQSTAIEMLQLATGTSIDALMKATGWQQHSVRGFLSGVVRKRLKMNLDSVVVDGTRIYRIHGDSSDEPAASETRRRKS